MSNIVAPDQCRIVVTNCPPPPVYGGKPILDSLPSVTRSVPTWGTSRIFVIHATVTYAETFLRLTMLLSDPAVKPLLADVAVLKSIVRLPTFTRRGPEHPVGQVVVGNATGLRIKLECSAETLRQHTEHEHLRQFPGHMER